MSAVFVRRATESDSTALLNLIDALADCEHLPRPDVAARERLLRDAFGTAPRFECLLALDGPNAVGYAIYFQTYSSFLARPTLYLEDLFVQPAARSHGAGSALFRAVAHEAVRRSCGRMEWMVLTWNALAIDFYQRRDARPLDGWRPYRLEGEPLAAAARRG